MHKRKTKSEPFGLIPIQVRKPTTSEIAAQAALEAGWVNIAMAALMKIPSYHRRRIGEYAIGLLNEVEGKVCDEEMKKRWKREQAAGHHLGCGSPTLVNAIDKEIAEMKPAEIQTLAKGIVGAMKSGGKTEGKR